jgi:hypothetical protein
VALLLAAHCAASTTKLARQRSWLPQATPHPINHQVPTKLCALCITHSYASQSPAGDPVTTLGQLLQRLLACSARPEAYAALFPPPPSWREPLPYAQLLAADAGRGHGKAGKGAPSWLLLLLCCFGGMMQSRLCCAVWRGVWQTLCCAIVCHLWTPCVTHGRTRWLSRRLTRSCWQQRLAAATARQAKVRSVHCVFQLPLPTLL